MSTTNELITETFYRILTEEDLSANEKEIIQNLIVLADKSAEKIAEYLTKMNNVFANPDFKKNPRLSAEEKKKLSKFGLEDLDIDPRHLEKIKDEPEDPTKSKFYLDSNQPDYYNEMVQKLLDDYETRHKIWKQQMMETLKKSAGFLKGYDLPAIFTKLVENFKKEWNYSFYGPFVEAIKYFPETEQIVKDLLDASKMPETRQAQKMFSYHQAEEIQKIKGIFKNREKIETEFYAEMDKLTNAAIQELDSIMGATYKTDPRAADPDGNPQKMMIVKPDPTMEATAEESRRLYSAFLDKMRSAAKDIQDQMSAYDSMLTFDYDLNIGKELEYLYDQYDETFKKLYTEYENSVLKIYKDATTNSPTNQKIQKVLEDLKDAIKNIKKKFNPFILDRRFSDYGRNTFSRTVDGIPRYVRDVSSIEMGNSKKTEYTTYPNFIFVVPEEIFEKFKTMASKIKEFKNVLEKKDPSVATPETSLDTVTNSEKFKNRPRY